MNKTVGKLQILSHKMYYIFLTDWFWFADTNETQYFVSSVNFLKYAVTVRCIE